MNNNAGTPKPKRAKRARGGQPGNQNARRHGRYSQLHAARRAAYLREVLRSYGIEDTLTVDGTPLEALAAESNISLIFILAMLHNAAQLADLQAQLAEAEHRLNRR